MRLHQPFLDISVQDWKRTLETSLSSAFYLARAVLPKMKERGWGRIVHISGRDGFFTLPNRAHNVSAKAALHSLAKAIAIEFGPFGITANTIAPGKMDTERDEVHYPGYRERFARSIEQMPLRRLGTGEDVGQASHATSRTFPTCWPCSNKTCAAAAFDRRRAGCVPLAKWGQTRLAARSPRRLTTA